jgi:hypothetical protein
MIERNAYYIQLAKESTVRSKAHARAVIGGIIAEAVRAARQRDPTISVAPFKTAWQEAIKDLNAAAVHLPVYAVLSSILENLTVMSLFDPSLGTCGPYGMMPWRQKTSQVSATREYTTNETIAPCDLTQMRNSRIS